jgi:hypothetical protein
MDYIKIAKRPNIENDKKLLVNYQNFENLLSELEQKEIPSEIKNFINQEIEAINSFSGTDAELSKKIRKTLSGILKRIEKELKLVPKNYYRGFWLALGMSAFGIPIGFAIALSMGNMAFLGTGFPIGMGIGVAVGTAMDKKAMNTGKQLDFEMKY